MRIKIGRIPYLNTEPFFGDDAVRAAATVASPREMVRLALKGEVDVAPLPVVANFEHPRLFLPIEVLGIASNGPATSVILKSNRPPEELANRRIGVIDETATSVRLLKVLLTYRFLLSRPARYEPLSSGHDAMLLIGDRALREGAPSDRYPFVLDLAAAWKEWTGLPFVFARWMARSNADGDEVNRIAGYFSDCLDRNLAEPEILWRRRTDLGLNREQVASYVRAFEYRLGEAALEGLARFAELDSKLQLKENAA